MLRALALRGHQVDVVLSAQAGIPYTLDGVNIYPVVDARKDVFTFLPDADIIVTHLDNTTRATVLGEFNDKPVAVVHHNTFEASKEAILLPSSRTDLVAVNSIHMADELKEFFTLVPDRSQPPTVITRPVASPAEYATTPGSKVTLVNLRKRGGVDSGRDGLSKGGELFRAVAEMLPDVEFLGVTGIYGEQQELEDLPNVEVVPHVPHDRMRDDVYGRTRVLLVPSSYESWGRVASEAMCSGIPVVASPTPGLVEQLGDAGTFIDPVLVSEWADAIRALTVDDSWWSILSERSKRRSAELWRLAERDLAKWCQAVEQAVANQQIREAVT